MRGSDSRHFGLLGWIRLFRECDHQQHPLCQNVILLMNGYGKMPIFVVILRSKFVTAKLNSLNFYFSNAFVMVHSTYRPQVPLPYDAAARLAGPCCSPSVVVAMCQPVTTPDNSPWEYVRYPHGVTTHSTELWRLKFRVKYTQVSLTMHMQNCGQHASLHMASCT